MRAMTTPNLPCPECGARIQQQDRIWSDYPLGTLAHAYNGGAWLRVHGGWQWNGHTPNPGDTFYTPGGEAIGACVELPT